MSSYRPIIAGVSAACLIAGAAPAQSPIRLDSPRPFQVIQRQVKVLFKTIERNSTDSEKLLGEGEVVIRGKLPSAKDAIWEWRATLLDQGVGKGIDWSRLDFHADASTSTAKVRLGAGGWYRLEVRARQGETVLEEAAVEPIGIGELFLIAGQSYASNCNDERLRVVDPLGRVVAFQPRDGSWAVAHDPQPVPDGSEAGSIWPALGDLMVPTLNVPIGFINVAWGGTASAQWMPGESLHVRLVDVGKRVGVVRAVLWQQGESDVIGKVSTEQYVDNLKAIRQAASDGWGFAPPWLLAKSTLHPTVYSDPVGEQRIRGAIDQLWQIPGFKTGPDTDLLAGENRGGPDTRRHFSAIGQRRAAEMWWDSLQKQFGRSD